MRRRTVLHTLAALACGGSAGACSHAPLRPAVRATSGARYGASTSDRSVRAICFDLFTLFDPRGVVAVAQSVVGAQASELCETWRTRQFQYAFLRAAAGEYRDFRAVTEDALLFAAESQGVALEVAQRERLVRAYSELPAWPDTRELLTRFRSMGLLLAPLANYAPSMLEPLLANAGLTSSFDALISTHAARSFKPAPAAYALAESRLGLPRDQIAFAAFGGWDAAGARWFGFPTFWVNRLGVTADALAPGPDAAGPSLRELEAFVVERGVPAPPSG